MVDQDQGIATQREFDEERVGRAAIRIAITIESCFTPQAIRVNPAAVADTVPKTGWQLVEPDLPDFCPAPIPIASEEFLPAAAGAVHAIHHAEQGRAASRGRAFERQGTPNRALAGREPVMPDGPNLPRPWRVEKDDLFAGRHVGWQGTG